MKAANGQTGNKKKSMLMRLLFHLLLGFSMKKDAQFYYISYERGSFVKIQKGWEND